MRITGVEQEINSTSKLQLPKEVIQIIEQLSKLPLSQRSLSIEKVLLSQNTGILIDLLNSKLVSKISLPITIAEILSPIKEVPYKVELNLIKLNIENSLIELKLTPATSIKTGEKIPLNNDSIKIYFKQAKIIKSDHIKLSQALQSAPVIQEKTINETTLNKTKNTESNSIQNSQTNPLKQQIKNFLKVNPHQENTISNNLNRLIKLSDSLLLSLNQTTEQSEKDLLLKIKAEPLTSSPLKSNKNKFNQQVQISNNRILSAEDKGVGRKTKQTEKPSTLTKQQVRRQNNNLLGNNKNALSLNKTEVLELLKIAIKILPKNHSISEVNLIKSLQNIFKEIDNIKQIIDFSQQNKQLKPEQRIQSSGLFYESNLKSEFINKNKTNEIPGKSNLKNNSQERPENNKKTHFIKETAIDVSQNIEASSKKIVSKTAKHSNTHLLDLKQLSFNLEHTLKSLTGLLAQSNLKPLSIEKLINQIIQHVFQLQTEEQTITNKNDSQQIITKAKAFIDKQTNHQSLKDLLIKHPLFNRNHYQTNQKYEANSAHKDRALNLQLEIVRELQKETQSIINKIENNQLLSLNTSQTKNESLQVQQFLIDLPILKNHQVESFELLFQFEENKDLNKPSKKWTVTIKFDLQPLGPMFAKVSLKNNRISTHFFAEKKETAQLLEDHIGHLKESLFIAGLDIEEVNGQQGLVPEKLMTNHEYSIDICV